MTEENENNDEKERETSNSERLDRQEVFSTPAMLIVISCLAVVLGGLHYANETKVELQQESRTVSEQYESDGMGRLTVEPKQDSLESTGIQGNAKYYTSSGTRDSLEPKSNVDTQNVLSSSFDSERTGGMDRTGQRERDDSIAIQTPISGSNIITSQMEEGSSKLTDKEPLVYADRKTDDETASFVTKKKSSSTTDTQKDETKKRCENDDDDDDRTRTISNEKQSVTEDSKEDFKTLLPRRDAVKVGFVQKLELQPGKFYDVITRSLRPPIFEIQDFLTDSECQKLINQATKLGLKTSPLHQPDVNIEPTNQETFKGWDYNEDDLITPQEIIHTFHDTSYLFFNQEDIEQMFHDLSIDQNGDGAMDLDEFLRVTNSRIVHYLQKLSTRHRRTMHRNSRHTWLRYDDVEGLNQRVSALTKIPVYVVERSENLQVVNYGPEGHYYCHLDSENIEKDIPCCLANYNRQCRLCRYITVLCFLNDVDEGGETAFPVADNATFSVEDWAVNMKYHCDLSKQCHQANVYVKPRKGTAVMWYNHLRDDETGWMGRLDPRSYHGGCDVIKGQKWIANTWININGESHDTFITYHPGSDPIP